MTSTFDLDKRIKKLISIEGGDKYTNDPDDKGGPTRWGVTQAIARAFGYSGDMQFLPYEKAVEIYKKLFWYGPKFDVIAKISDELASICFDWGVNAGPTVPVKAMQRCLNALNDDEKQYKDLVCDGVLGNVTFYALDKYIELRKKEGLALFLQMLRSLRSVFYIELVEKSKTQEKFEYGWQRRTFFE